MSDLLKAAIPLKCSMCGGTIDPVRLECIPHTKTCGRGCSSDRQRMLRRDSLSRHRDRLREKNLRKLRDNGTGGHHAPSRARELCIWRDYRPCNSFVRF